MSSKTTRLIQQEILSRQDDPSMKVADIVDSVMLGLDPEKKLLNPELDPEKKLLNLEIYSLSIKQVNNMVRSELNKMHGRPKDAQGNLLPSLQKYYPGSDKQSYIRLEQMSEADLIYNIHRLREEGKTKIAHSKDLEEYWRRKFPDTNVSSF